MIFFYYAQEEVLTWDYPAQREALDAAGIVSICLSGQPYVVDVAQIKATLAPFIATLRA